MKRKLLFITLCVATLTFTGCGKQETPVTSNNVEIEIEPETTIEDEVTITEEIEEPTENVTEETVENTTNTEEIPSNGEGQVETPSADGFDSNTGFNPSENITQNPDGSYSFSDEFMVSVKTINGFSDLTPENQQKLLQEIAPFLVEMDNEEEITTALGAFVGMYEYDQAKAEREQTQQQTQTQQKPQPSQQTTVESQPNISTPEVQPQGMQSSSQEQNISGRRPADGTPGSHDENAATGGVGTHHTPPPSQEQVIGGPPCADGTAGGQIAHDTISSWR